jgi:hypothetical protein
MLKHWDDHHSVIVYKNICYTYYMIPSLAMIRKGKSSKKKQENEPVLGGDGCFFWSIYLECKSVTKER